MTREERTPQQTDASAPAGPRAAAATKAAVQKIPRIATDRPVDLSFGQERMWFFEQMSPGAPPGRVAWAWSLRGPLVVEALEESIREVVRRHELLRTTFEEIDGRPQMVIHPTMTVPLELVDVSELPEAERTAAAKQALAEILRRPFDLERKPAIATRLVRVAPDDHHFVISMHHIVTDGWSTKILHTELTALYSARVTKTPVTLPEPAVSYADFAAWQRVRVGENALASDVDYWKRQLVGSPKSLDLPADYPRPRFKQFNGACVDVVLSPELVAQVNELCRCQHATVFMVVLAAYTALLSRWSGQKDIVVGTQSAGRSEREFESVVGPFIESLPLRTSVAGDPTFAELLKRVVETVLGALRTNLPFDKIVESQNLPRDTSRTVLFQACLVAIVANNNKGSAATFSGLVQSTSALAAGENAGAQFDLTIRLFASTAAIVYRLEYDIALFERSTMERFANELVALLAAVTRDPNVVCDRVSLMTAEERERVLVEWNATPLAAAPVETLLSLIPREGDGLAVVAGESKLTYAELDRRSNAMAHQLVAAGVKPGDLVGVSAAPFAELPCVLLAVWKAGAAFTLVAESRLAELATHVVALVEAPGRSLRTERIRTISLTEDAPRSAPPEVAPDPSRVALVHPARPGAPFGESVVVEHVQLAAHVRAAIQRFELPGGSHAIGTALTNEVVVGALFAALTTGATLHLVEEDICADDTRFAHYLTEHAIDVLTIASSEFLAPSGGGSALPRKRLILADSPSIGPRASLSDDVRALLSSADPAFRMFHVDARPETTAGVLAFDLARIGAERFSGVPAGRPLPGSRVYVLDVAGNPSSIGVFGELVVAGPQIARGYLADASRTAARFVRDALANDPRARRFHTGERARWLASGEIELARVAADTNVGRKRLRVPPRSPFEQEIAQIWSDALGIGDFGIDDDFFELGGHSLLVTKVTARLRAQLERDVPIQALFEAPTVAGLAARLEAASTAVVPPPIVRTSIESGSVLSFWQESILSWERKRPPSTTWTRPILVSLKGALDVTAMTDAIAQVMERQESFRQLLFRDPAIVPRLCKPGDIPVKVVDMRGATAEDIAAFIRDEAEAPFAFDGTPLARFYLVRRAGDEHSLSMTWHQLVHDATASGFIVAELLEAYRARVEQRAPQLEPLQFRYTDYAAWERAWFDGGGRPLVESARKRLVGARPLALPTDRPRNGTPGTAGLAGTFVLDPTEATRFAQMCQSAQVTFFMGAVAASAILLGRWCNTDDVTVVSPISTRTRDDVRSLGGRFGNWSALRISLEGDPTVREVLARTRRDATAAYTHASVPGSLFYEATDVFGHPLGRVVVNMPEADTVANPQPIEAGGVTALPERLPKKEQCRTELAIVIIRSNKRIIGNLAGPTDLFDASTLEGWAKQLGDLFRTLDLDARISTMT